MKDGYNCEPDGKVLVMAVLMAQDHMDTKEEYSYEDSLPAYIITVRVT